MIIAINITIHIVITIAVFVAITLFFVEAWATETSSQRTKMARHGTT